MKLRKLKYKVSEWVKRWLLNGLIDSTWEKIRNYSTQDLAKAYCELNCGDCPMIMHHLQYKYDGWKRYQMRGLAFDLRHTFSLGVMQKIVSHIGRKETSRYWNVVHQKNMTEQQFEMWWSLRNNMAEQMRYGASIYIDKWGSLIAP